MRFSPLHTVGTWMTGLTLAVVATTCHAQDKPNTAIKPEPRPGAWVKQHEKFLERTKEGDVDLLFLGDSITAGWNNNAVWKRHYGPRKAANFGIGGDRTQHILWRLENGEGDGLKPKVVVLMIGTNNVASNTDGEIVAGITACVEKIRAKFPEAKVLLLGVFPRAEDMPKARKDKVESAAAEPRIAKINEQIAKLDDGKTVHYLDIGDRFLDSKGQVPRDVMPDYLHLSLKGYEIWADAIEPKLWSLLDEKKAEKDGK